MDLWSFLNGADQDGRLKQAVLERLDEYAAKPSVELHDSPILGESRGGEFKNIVTMMQKLQSA